MLATSTSSRFRDKENPHRGSSTPDCRGTKIRKVAARFRRPRGAGLKWLMLENVPGSFPLYRGHLRVQTTEGEDTDPDVRGEGDGLPHQPTLQNCVHGGSSQAPFNGHRSVTKLYGADPDPSPDIYGKVGKTRGFDRNRWTN